MSTKNETTTVTAGELVREFSHYSDVALKRPVTITKNGRPRNVLLSSEEYSRLKGRDQEAFLAEDAPEELLADLKAFQRIRKYRETK